MSVGTLSFRLPSGWWRVMTLVFTVDSCSAVAGTQWFTDGIDDLD
jgi:hypothetical protein